MKPSLTKMILALLLLASKILHAQEVGMTVVPARLVYNKHTNYHEFTITNTGTDSTTYLIRPKHYRMLRNGALNEITTPDPGQYFASDNLYYEPKQMTLAPGQSQVVQVQVTGRENLTHPEYRSHLCIRTETKHTTYRFATDDAHGIAATLIPSLAVTLPVIVRGGDPAVNVRITDAQYLAEENPRLQLTLNRDGNMSVYGHLEVHHVSPGGEMKRVAMMKGVAVYSPTKERTITVKLDKSAAYYNGGSLRMIYTSLDDDERTTITEHELMLPTPPTTRQMTAMKQ